MLDYHNKHFKGRRKTNEIIQNPKRGIEGILRGDFLLTPLNHGFFNVQFYTKCVNVEKNYAV